MEHDDRDRGGPHLGEPGQLFSEEAIALHAQFAQHGDFDVLAKAVGLYCAALATGPLEPASRARLLNNLTAALKVVFEHQEAIGAHPQGHPDYLFSLNKLADTIHTRFRHFGDLNFLAEVITLRRLALNLRPSGNSERSSSLDSLATALITRLEHTGDPDSLTEAIDLHRQALDLRPLGHPDRFCSLNNLAIALHTRFRQVGDIDLLTEEIDLFRQSLDLLPTGHPTRPALLNNIANVLKTRFQHLGDDKSLEEAIETHREVLKLRPPGHPARSNTLNNLANALKNQFQHLGDFGLLTEAIGLHREALDLRPPGHSDHSVSLDNLGSTLCLRFNQLGDVDSIREGTELHRQALRLRPPGHPARAISLSNLADALTTRYEQLRDVDSLTEAVELLREAQDIYPLGHPNRPSSLSKLAAVLCYRFEQHRDMNLLEEAIELRRCALALCPQSHIARPAALASLGRALSARFEERHDVRDLDEEMSLAREGLQSCVRGHPMRQHFLFALGTCMLQTDTYVFDFENGIHHILEALRDITSPARQSLSEAVHVLHTVQAAFLCMTDRASISELSGSGYDRMVLHVYALVIRLMPRVASFGLDRLQRLRELSQAYTVSRDAAAHAIRTGHTTEAVEMLEEGRSVFWAQVLRLRTDLDLLPTQDADELRRLFRTLESGSRCDDSLNTVLRDRHIEEHRRMGDVAEALVAEIRSRPGMSRFMQPPTFSTLVQGLPEAGFVVLLVASELGYHALVINRAAGASTQPKSITLAPPQGGFFSEAVRETMPRDGGSGDHLSRNPYTSRAFGVSKKNNQSREPIDATLEQLWISIVKPIIDVLGLESAAGLDRPRVWWCVTGELTFLPIHAAGITQNSILETAADYFVSSYVPTLAALINCRVNWSPIPVNEVTGILAACRDSPHQAPLHNVACEIDGVAVRFREASAQVLHSFSPNSEAQLLRDVLANNSAHILHLACHSVQRAENPLDSAFLLSDGCLSIQDFMEIRPPDAVLAFLSACQTARGNDIVPDEAVHLAASMLFCGFKSVVATMWMMNDDDGPDFASWFYNTLFSGEKLDLDGIAYALDAAVTMLRKKGVPASRWALFIHVGG